MAGSSLKLFTPAILLAAQRTRLNQFIDVVADRVEEAQFWVAGQPFSVSLDAELYPEDEELLIEGWHPRALTVLTSYTSAHTAHVLLGFLACRSAELIGAHIDLGDIRTLTTDMTVLTLDGIKPTTDGRYIVSPDFLRYWMGAPDFRLLRG